MANATPSVPQPPQTIPPKVTTPQPQPQTQQAAPIPADVKSVSQATPVVARQPEFGLDPTSAAAAALASGQVKQAAQEAQPPEQATTPPPPAAQQEPESRSDKLVRLLDQYVKITVLDGMHFTHRGVCTKCGWQSMQLSDAAAKQMVRQHVQAHWRDVAPQL